MALSTIAAALAQYNANSNWYQSTSAAQLRLEAIEFLVSQRAQQVGDQGSTLNYEALKDQAVVLREFLGAGPARSFGLPRTSPAHFGRRDRIP